MLNGFGIKLKVPYGYTLAKLRRDKQQARSLGRYFASMHSLSDKIRDYKNLIHSHYSV